MVADLLNTASVALLLLLLSTRSQLLLGQGHLLLHVADLLLGPATVLLEEQHKTDEEGIQKNKKNIKRWILVNTANGQGTLYDQKCVETQTLHSYVTV